MANQDYWHQLIYGLPKSLLSKLQGKSQIIQSTLLSRPILNSPLSSFILNGFLVISASNSIICPPDLQNSIYGLGFILSLQSHTHLFPCLLLLLMSFSFPSIQFSLLFTTGGCLSICVASSLKRSSYLWHVEPVSLISTNFFLPCFMADPHGKQFCDPKSERHDSTS